MGGVECTRHCMVINGVLYEYNAFVIPTERRKFTYQILYYTSMKYCDMIGQLKGVYFTYTPVKCHLYTCKFHVVTASYIKGGQN